MKSHEEPTPIAQAPRNKPGETPDLSIVVPTYKEAENIEPLGGRIFAVTSSANFSTELIVVDDDSQDGIDLKCRELATRYNVRLITRNGARGLATAVLHGMSQARGRLLVCMDADLSHPPEAIPAMVQALNRGADFVLASRYTRGGGIKHGWGPHRFAISKLATLLARPLASVTDPMSGFFALPRAEFLHAHDLAPLGYKVALELLVRLAPKRLVEVPIHFEDRRFGKSKLSLHVQLEYLRHLRRLYRYKYPFVLELGQFLLVGFLGLILDLGVYVGTQLFLGLNHILARSVAFICSGSHNWFRNRHHTFLYGRMRRPLPQWVSYLFVVSLGFLVNVGTYTVLTVGTRAFADRRYLAMLTGILAGAVLNFYVFSRSPARQ